MKDVKKDTHRIEKVNALLQQLVGEAIMPYTSNFSALVTVSRIETSRDMKWAKVWISIVSAADNKKTDTQILTELSKNLYDIQGEINRAMASKVVPRLQLFLDTAPRYAQHINDLINHLHDEDETSKKNPEV